jgi:hypothetical protein
MVKKPINSDLAPLQGRRSLERWCYDSGQGEMSWEGTDFSLWGEADASVDRHVIRVQGSINPQGKTMAKPGWIELETSPTGQEPVVEDIFLVGTRPLPCFNLNCISRHPLSPDYLVAATADGQLLLLDARLPENLKILREQHIHASLSALVCCGKMLLGLENGHSSGCKLHLIQIDQTSTPYPAFKSGLTRSLPVALTTLAENDRTSAWGATSSGELFLLQLDLSNPDSFAVNMQPGGRLQGRKIRGSLKTVVKELYQATRARRVSLRRLHYRSGRCSGLAYDGKHFWSFSASGQKPSILRLHDQDGRLLRSYSCHAPVTVSYLNYMHNQLLVLDQEHQQLHLYYLGDSMEAVACLAPFNTSHPGYITAGGPQTAGMHEMCLLYVGAQGRDAVHRYDQDKLLPLLAYLGHEGTIYDYFMDGFLMLAQYSPLLNGRSFGLDLTGAPSRKEDWLALFDEYFHPQANLYAMERCIKAIIKKLGPCRSGAVKVVLAIPTADPRCTDWDNTGYSLVDPGHRIAATRWAMGELVKRWEKADFRHLKLAGFYYLTEQGAYEDEVLHAFPELCNEYRLRSFAIPGITSNWLTEFSRAGFDTVLLQSSHAFWQPALSPPRYLLKCAGQIARHYGMGMEVELPYNVLEPAGRQKLRDYLEMAAIQGWAGTFTAYFQSYNLIKSLAESPDPECRQLYDELFRFTRLSRQQNRSALQSNLPLKFDCQASWMRNASCRLNIESHRGLFNISRIRLS